MKTNYVLWSVFGFILWGLFPIYFKQLSYISPWEVVSHRIVWSFFFLSLYIAITHSTPKFKKILSDTRSLILLALAALLISTNWITYVTAITTGHVLEASLAYFISPLFSILIGIFFFNEKNNIYKTFAIILCAIALIFKITYEQSLSSYAIIIAVTFTGYSVVKKKIPHHSLLAFFFEIVYLTIPAILYLYYLYKTNSLTFTWEYSSSFFLIVGLGIINPIPLLIFARSVKKIDLSVIGFLQYISPFMIFALATIVYKEKIGGSDVVVFSLIWVAVGIIIYESNRKKLFKYKYKF